MATTYAPTSNGLALHAEQQYGSPRSHGGQHRKAAPERLPTITSTSASPIDEKPTLDLNGEAYSYNNREAFAHNHAHSVPSANYQSNQSDQSAQPIQPTLPRRGHQYSHSYAPAAPNIYDGLQRMPQSLEKMEFPPAPTELQPELSPYGSHVHSHGHSHGHVHAEETQPFDSVSSKEIMASILIPLPFVLTALVLNSRYIPAAKVDPAIEKLDSIGGGQADLLGKASLVPYLSFFSICILTSSTLLLVGLISEVSRLFTPEDEKSQRWKTGKEIVSGNTVQRVLGRVLSVGLPFYAASKLGGERVAIAVLVTVAADIMTTVPKAEEIVRSGGLRNMLAAKKWTVGALGLQAAADALRITSRAGPWQSMLGYLALGCSIFLLPLPYPTNRPRLSFATSPEIGSEANGVFRAPWEAKTGARTDTQLSPLTSTPFDTDLTMASGVLAGATGIAVYFLSPEDSQTIDNTLIIGGFLTTITSALSLLLASPKSLKSSKRYGVAAGLILSIVFQELLEPHTPLAFLFQLGLIGLSWIGMKFDTRMARVRSGSIQQVRHRHPHQPYHDHSHESHSKITGILLQTFHELPLIHSILVEKDSRRIFYFMLLNLGFMVVQTFYALVTGSLGLLSDSVHMFFDCIALVVGLAAAVMSKWPPSIRFPYGYGKMDTLAGFANGVFLMLISVEIIYEAIERLAEGVQMQRLTELLIVSTLGLAVNCVGMLAFGHAHHGHGHDHSHGHSHDHEHSQEHSHSLSHGHDHDNSHGHDGCDDHGHSHGHNDSSLHLSPLPVSVPGTPSKPVEHSHSHHNHHHGHGNENMLGIWLHVLADTLGSLAVVISTVLIHYTGWAGFDPLASCLIAILIFGSAVPLVTSSAKRLLLTVPESTEFDIREAISGVQGLRGVAGVTAPRFWVGEGQSGKVEGVMHVVVGRGSDLDDARSRAQDYLRSRSMDVLVQVEREGEGRCWCGGGAKSP